MGLRIKERHLANHRELTENERSLNLMREVAIWLAARGGAAAPGEGVDQASFVNRFEQAKARLGSPDHVLATAGRIRDTLLRRQKDSASLHNQVDIATLLELL